MKSHEKDIKHGEGLAIGSTYPSHKKGLVNSLGNHQGSNDAPKAESNTETLRHGKTPKPEGVQSRPTPNTTTQKRAHGFNERSQNGGAEKGGGW